MKVLVACEFSGVVREAFRKKGHEAWSCDILPSEGGNSWHYETDIIELLNRPYYKWDLMITHPPCTYLTGETKATCLWLKNLPPLKPTKIVEGREARIHKMPPSKDRSKLRSITFQGIADAMAEQWG